MNFKSRKLLAAVIGVSLHLINGYLDQPIDETSMEGLTSIIIGYVIGQGFADLGKEGKILAKVSTQLGGAVKERVEESENKEADPTDIPS